MSEEATSKEGLIIHVYAQGHTLNVNTQLANGAKLLNLAQSLHLLPNFVYASSEGPD